VAQAPQDATDVASAETGDAVQIAQPAPQPATQATPSLLAALTGDTAQAPDVAAETQMAAPEAAPAIGEAQLAAATATAAATTQGAADTKPAAAAESKTPQAGKIETQTAEHKPDPDIATVAANDNAAPDASQPDAAPIIAAEPAAKPAPQTANTNMAVQAPAPAQHTAANTPAQAAQVAQHVEVSATPKPNIPALAVEISAKSQSGAKQFDIRLDPPELGRVEVRLSIDAAGKASAHLSADQPQTLDLLQKDASILTRALRDAGLDMAQGSLNFSLRQQTQGQHSGEQRGQSRGARTLSLTATQSIEASAAGATYRANGGVDIRV
jgi:flagellar hook-length control protein FliK